MSPFARILYRLRQFRLAFLGPWPAIPEEALRPLLSPSLLSLFRRMSRAEQAHSLAMMERLRLAGLTDPHLLSAALLHDVGKVRLPLSTLGRGLVVLGRRFLPRLAQRWGEAKANPLTRAFVTAGRHPEWGAEMAAEAGASARTCDLIRRHQEKPGESDPLLAALQEADDFE